MNFLFPLLSEAASVAEYDPAQYDIGLFSAIDGLIVATVGYAVVFLGLIALMAVVIVIGKIFSRKKAEKAAEAQTQTAEVQAVVEETAEPEVAPGTAGELKLHDVPTKTAAMLMAIVADKMGKPLNELRFISIKEVK